MKAKWIVFLLVTGAVAGMVAIFGGAFGKDVHEVPFMMKGAKAPAFTLERLDGQGSVSLEQLKGTPIVLNFWASWCGPCASEHSTLLWGHRRFGSKVQFLGAVFEDTPEKAQAYLAEYGGTYPQLVDPGSRMAIDYAVAGVPETYFISASGIIVDKYVGPIPPEELAARVQALMGTPMAGLSGGFP